MSLVHTTSSNVKITNMSCTIGDPQECCNERIGVQGNPTALWFCLMMCVICCTKCTIEFETNEGSARADNAPLLPANPTPFPTFTRSGAGFSFTTSQFGKFLPIVFGSDKLTGNVFWTSSFSQETVTLENVPYSYATVSFALGLAEGPINGMLRLWLGEELLIDNTSNVDINGVVIPDAQGAIAGAFINLVDPASPLAAITDGTLDTKITVFAGGETQIPPQIMDELEGEGNSPGYRGTAYVLFENFVITNNQIPNIFVEITANTQTLAPRLFGLFDDPGVLFDESASNSITFDPSYDLIHSWATGPGGDGIASWDANTLANYQETETNNSGLVETSFFNGNTWLTTTGHVILTAAVDLTVYAFNPFTQVIDDTIEAPVIPSSSSKVVFTTGVRGRPVDIFVGIPVSLDPPYLLGWDNLTSSWTEITTANMIVDVRGQADSYSAVLNLNTEDVGNNPTFFDGSVARGTYVYHFDAVGAITQTELQAYRITVNSDAVGTPEDAISEIVETIPLDQFGSDGLAHDIVLVLVDPIDKMFVIFVEITGASRDNFIFKWNPYTNAVLWQTKFAEPFPSFVSDTPALLTLQKFGWIGISGSGDNAHTIDLKTGTITKVIDDLALENFVIADINDGAQVYNGQENSVMFSYDNNVLGGMAKLFLERITRSTVELSDIIKNLIARVGNDLQFKSNTNDLTALTLQGYTINKISTLRQVFAELAQVFLYDVIETNGSIEYKIRGGATVETIDEKYLGDIDTTGWFQETQKNEFGTLRKLDLSYRDIDREYHDSVQSVYLPNISNEIFDNEAAVAVRVPVVLSADTAKGLAETLLYAKNIYNSTYQLSLPPRFMHLDPGDVVDVSLDAGARVETLRIRSLAIGDNRQVSSTMVKEDVDIYNDQVDLFGSIGRFETSKISNNDPRMDALVLTIPYRNDTEAAEQSNLFQVFLTVVNLKNNLNPLGGLTVIFDGVERFDLDAPLAFPTWGFVTQPLSDTEALYTTDDISDLHVRLVSTDGGLPASTTKLLMNDDDELNLAYIGGELIQFETATDLGAGIWQFQNIRRAKMGTDPSAFGHTVGEKFVILDPSSVVKFLIDLGDSPRKAVQVFVDSSNPFQPSTIQYYLGLNLRPWTVHDVDRTYVVDDAVIAWKRRTRFGGDFLTSGDVGDVPLNESNERYELFLFTDPTTFSPGDSTTYLRQEILAAPVFTYTAAQQTIDGFDRVTETLYIFPYQTSGDGAQKGAGQAVALAPTG